MQVYGAAIEQVHPEQIGTARVYHTSSEVRGCAYAAYSARTVSSLLRFTLPLSRGSE